MGASSSRTRAPRPPRLELRLLGGFEARVRGVPAAGFESKKARALLALLALEADRPVARDRAAALLWPDLEPDSARRNLRQALYNLRSVLGDGAALLGADGHELRLGSGGLTVDVAAFAAAAEEGLEGRGALPLASLGRALELYRGELLAGLRLRENEPFDEWLAGERDRLHALAVEVARQALRRSEADGEHAAALGFARRLGALEPLSEEAGRAQVRLLARLGRRPQALRHYAELAGRLERELGVEPGEAARALRKAILEGQELPAPEGVRPGPPGPLVPFVGRERAWRELSRVWGEVRRGAARSTVVLGNRGMGKTRLVRWFLHDAFSGGAGTVLLARCPESSDEPLRATLAEALASLPHDPPAHLRPAIAAALAALPEAARRRLDLAAGPPAASGDDPLAAFAALLGELGRAARPGWPGPEGRPAPVALFVDDLEQAPEVLDGLLALLERNRGAPLWIVAAARSDEISLARLAAARTGAAGGRVAELDLGPIEPADVERATRALIGEGEAGPVTAALLAASRGHPLALAEAVNLLADEGTLRPASTGGWRLADPEALARGLPAGVEALVDRRVARLPTTSRRLLGLAAVAGDRFDTDTLLEVDREHPAVLEAALGILVERWLVRPFLRSWIARRRDRDVALWKAGARRGPFEFAQRVVRRRVYETIDPRRRRELHLALAGALAASSDPERRAEAPRHHRAAASLPP